MTLRGPAHPDTFRVQVGRYGDRWYHDPLPACDIAPATDEQWPSVSIVKGAWPKNLGPWMAQEAARFAVAHRDTWTNLPDDAAVDMIAKASDRTRNRAADRGTEVHRLLEMIADGHEPHEALIPDAAPYLPVLRQLVADLHLTPDCWIYSEVVCISRTVGYGGTADAAIRIPDTVPSLGGQTLAIDWKSRAADRHDAYRDECAQLAAYGHCDYIIAEVDGQAARRTPPALDGGLIVSITPDDYRLYPVHLDAAWESFTDLRRFWDTTKRPTRGKHLLVPRRSIPAPATPTDDGDPFDGITATRSPAAAPPTAPGTSTAAPVEARVEGDGGGSSPPPAVASPQRVEWARDRLLAIIAADPNAGIDWPAEVPSFAAARAVGYAHTDDDIDAIVAALASVESTLRVPFPEVDDPGRSDVAPVPVAEDDPTQTPPRVMVAETDPRIPDLHRRVEALPPDLLAEFDAEAITRRRLPKFHRGHGTEAQLAEAIAILEPLEATAASRQSIVTLALSILNEKGCAPITALAVVGATDSTRMTEWEAEALDDLACAVADGNLLVVDGSTVVAVDGVETTLTNHVAALVGAKTAGRRELLAVAKDVADRRRVERPRSCDDVLASPVLVAGVAMTEPAAPAA